MFSGIPIPHPGCHTKFLLTNIRLSSFVFWDPNSSPRLSRKVFTYKHQALLLCFLGSQFLTQAVTQSFYLQTSGFPPLFSGILIPHPGCHTKFLLTNTRLSSFVFWDPNSSPRLSHKVFTYKHQAFLLCFLGSQFLTQAVTQSFYLQTSGFPPLFSGILIPHPGCHTKFLLTNIRLSSFVFWDPNSSPRLSHKDFTYKHQAFLLCFLGSQFLTQAVTQSFYLQTSGFPPLFSGIPIPHPGCHTKFLLTNIRLSSFVFCSFGLLWPGINIQPIVQGHGGTDPFQ